MGFAISLALAAPRAWADTAEDALAAAYSSGEMPNARGMAMGGAAYALGGSTSATVFNPANLGLLKSYHMDAIAAFAPVASRQSYGAMVADSSTTKTAMGLSGTYNMMDHGGLERTWWDARLGAAYPLGDRAFIGLVGRYMSMSQTDTRTPGTKVESSPLDGFSAGAGVAFALGDALRLGLVGENLLGAEGALMPRRVAGGLGLSLGEFAIEANGVLDLTSGPSSTWGVRAGAEWMSADRVPLRVGYTYDEFRKSQAVSGGLGYMGNKIGFEASVRHEFTAVTPATSFMFGLRYFVDVAGGSAADDASGDSDGL